jgi:XTP/dITP diphosphohydrolase
MTFVLASNNAKKLTELREILSGLGLEVVSQQQAGLSLEVEETGRRSRENAYLKAKGACDALGLPAIADDSGLEVAALGGAPGVRSARYGAVDGVELSSAERNALLLRNTAKAEDRRARFVSAIACVFPDGTVIRARGEVQASCCGRREATAASDTIPSFISPSWGKAWLSSRPERRTPSRTGAERCGNSGKNSSRWASARIRRLQMLNSRQRAQLRGLGNGLDTILQIGKGGITENVVRQLDDALTARELVKCRVLETSLLTAREACEELCAAVRAEPVQVIGTRFILYRPGRTLPPEKRIRLVK